MAQSSQERPHRLSRLECSQEVGHPDDQLFTGHAEAFIDAPLIAGDRALLADNRCNRKMTLREMTLRILVAALAFTLTVSTDGRAQTTSEIALDITPADEIADALKSSPTREGAAPETPDGIPHQQLSQNAPLAMVQALTASAIPLPGIVFAPTPFSLQGSLGWNLAPGFDEGPDDAFIRRTQEFGHQHRVIDGSMHLLLPSELAAIALEKGWGVIHPIDDEISGETSTYVMIYGARNLDELETVWIIAQISYYQARGLSMEPKSSTAIIPSIWGRVKDILP